MHFDHDDVITEQLRPWPTPGEGPELLLVGPMGAGKSTLGRAIAKSHNLSFADVDDVIEGLTGLSIPEIFQQWGEERFRDIEHRVIRHLIATHSGVLSLGGGALGREETRTLLADLPVLWLDVSKASAHERLFATTNRPMLSGEDPMGRWAELYADREAHYRDTAALRIDTSGMDPHDIVEGIGILLTAQRHHRSLQASSSEPVPSLPGEKWRTEVHDERGRYPVIVGRGILQNVPDLVPARAAKVMIIHQAAVREHAEAVHQSLLSGGRQAYLVEIPDGEQAKTSQVLAFLWQVLGQTDLTRSDLIIGIGGGAATDLAGFAAASWLRGIDVLQVPTTVAGMVDAAIGGKTGINTAEGKNLVGAFHPPIGVLADLELLASLPHNDVAAGLAEAVKGGFIRDTTILDLVESDPRGVLDTTTELFAEVLCRAIQVKADVVGGDLTEQGEREILNYGHTLGHAIERNERYMWRHGAAVSVGMMFAAELSHLSGKLTENEVDRHRSILTSLGLPTTYRDRQWPKLEDSIKRDKKARGNLLRFVVLDAVGVPSRVEGPDPAILLAAYAAITDPEADAAHISRDGMN